MENKELVKNFVLIRKSPSNNKWCEPGVVAVGSIFEPSKKVVIQWTQKINAINVYDKLEDFTNITCSHSDTQIEFL